MELDQCILPSNWGFCYEEEGMEELRYCLLHTTLELEKTIVSAKEEIVKREDELLHLKDLLSKAIREKNEAQSECKKLIFDNLMLNQQLQKKQNHHGHDHQHLKQPEEEALFASHSEEDPKGSESNKHFVPSDTTEENTLTASPDIESVVLQPPLLPQSVMKLADGKPLPEKGKLLHAVMDAGPLLQTLLLAGPLPQWQHPPPRLDSIDIPPVAISPPPSRLLQHQHSCITTNDCFGKMKRSLSLSEGSDFCSSTKKYQKVVLH